MIIVVPFDRMSETIPSNSPISLMAPGRSAMPQNQPWAILRRGGLVDNVRYLDTAPLRALSSLIPCGFRDAQLLENLININVLPGQLRMVYKVPAPDPAPI